MAVKLLVADDSATIVKILSLALSNEDYEIDSVGTAAEAVQRLNNSAPDIFLVDIALPEQDGLELTRIVKESPSLQSIRVAVLANAFDTVDKKKCEEVGVDEIIVKPFDPSDLREKLRRLAQSSAVKIESTPPAKPKIGEQITNTKLRRPEPLDSTRTSIDVTELRENNKTASPDKTSEDLSASAQELASFFAKEVDKNQTQNDNINETLGPESMAFADSSRSSHSENNEPFYEIYDHFTENNNLLDQTEESLQDVGEQDRNNDVLGHDNLLEEPTAPTIDLRQELNSWAPDSAPVFEQELAGWSSQGHRFDIGDASFQFSPDYIQRISISGESDPEEIGGLKSSQPIAASGSKQQLQIKKEKLESAPSAFSDSAANNTSRNSVLAAPTISAAEVERIMREEIRGICHEVAEQIAWETIPELAENIIRAELKKILDNLDANPDS